MSGSLVVVGVDGSSSSDLAVVEAAREAQRRRASLRVVHAFTWPVGAMHMPLDPSALDRKLVLDAPSMPGVSRPTWRSPTSS